MTDLFTSETAARSAAADSKEAAIEQARSTGQNVDVMARALAAFERVSHLPVLHPAPVKPKVKIDLDARMGLKAGAKPRVYAGAIDPAHRGNRVPSDSAVAHYDFVARPEIREVLRLFEGRAKHGKKNLMFWGPTGTGKSKLVEAACWVAGVDFYGFTCSEDLSVTEFYIQKELINGETIAVPQGLLRAYHFGGMVCNDEINAMPANMGKITNKAENRELIEVPELGIALAPHPEFYMAGTLNPLYRGTNKLPPDKLDRYAHFEIGFMAEAKEQALVEKVFPTLGTSVAQTLVKLATEIRAAASQGGCMMMAATLSVRGVFHLAEAMLEAQNGVIKRAAQAGQQPSEQLVAQARQGALRKSFMEALLVPLKNATPEGEQSLAALQVYHNVTGDTEFKPFA